MSVCSLKVFDAVSLGPHEEPIRKMLLADDPGEPEQYGFLGVIPIIEGKFYPDWISEPDWTHYENSRLYRVVIGGVLYMFNVSNHLITLPHPCLFIQKNGDWILQYRDVREIEFLRQWFDAVGKAIQRQRCLEP